MFRHGGCTKFTGGGKSPAITLTVGPVDCNGICTSESWTYEEHNGFVMVDSVLCCPINITLRWRICNIQGTSIREVEITKVQPQEGYRCNCSVEDIMKGAIHEVLRYLPIDTTGFWLRNISVTLRTSKCWYVDSTDGFALKSCDTTHCYQTLYRLYLSSEHGAYLINHDSTEGNDQINPCDGYQHTCHDVLSSHDIPSGWLSGKPIVSNCSPNTLTIWFKQEIINKQLICDYWNYYHNPPITKEQLPKTLSMIPDGTGCFPVDSNIILNRELLQFLLDSGAVTMCQFTTFSPCVDTLSFTRNGDTIKTPPFWNSYIVKFNRDSVAGLLIPLLLRFCGKAIIFAELNYYFTMDGEPPNDTYFLSDQKNLQEEFGCNMPVAWDYERGNRDIKVGIIDNGFNYLLPEFGGGIGPDKRFVAGKYFGYKPNDQTQPPPFTMTNESDEGEPGVKGGWHGTPVSSFIGAITNNSLGVASIAGGWYDENLQPPAVVGGVSLYGLKCYQSAQSEINQKNLVDAWCTAAASTSGNQGYGVHIITASIGEAIYCEECRQALDFAYNLGVACFAAKGNDDKNLTCYPADYEYNKIMAVGAYDFYESYNHTFVPSRSKSVSNFGYGLDIMASGVDAESYLQHPEYFNEVISNDGTYHSPWGHTSGATPQVAAVGSLILSKYLRHENENIEQLYPEDVHGLLCISALDLNYEYYYDAWLKDTNGYDAETGYGMLKADKALEFMEIPYELRHFTETGGNIVEETDINNFLVLGPCSQSDEEPLLPPTQIGKYDYRAKRYKIHKENTLTDWEIARSWGLGGKGTKGWSRVQPIELDEKYKPKPDQYIAVRGYCRVVGDGMPGDEKFNFNNLRDISYRNDVVTLETYCYEVWNKDEAGNPDQGYKGWFPCEPDDVVYRYTVWGKKYPNSVSENKIFKPNKITIGCEQNKLFGSNYIVIHYKMDEPGPIELSVYDILGNKIIFTKRDTWNNSNEQRISIKADNLSYGIYLLVLKSNNSVGICKYLQTN